MNDPILPEMLMVVGSILNEMRSAPRDDVEFVVWANEVLDIEGVGRMRRTVYHSAIVGPAMAYVLRVSDSDPREGPYWKQMMAASVHATEMCDYYGQDGRKLNFEEWVEEMASVTEAHVKSTGNGWELHTEYIGLDVRIPEEILRDDPLTLYTHTLCDGEGEPRMDVPTRYSPSLDEALADHKVWADELRDEE